MRVATLHLPEEWHFESKIEWHYGWVEYPVSYSVMRRIPTTAEAYFQYPLLRLESTELPPQLKQYDKGRQYRPGERLPPALFSSPPQPPMQAMAKFIQSVRPMPPISNGWGNRTCGPGQGPASGPRANQHGVAIKIGYDLKRPTVEEAFFGVYYLSQGANAGVNAGMIKQTN